MEWGGCRAWHGAAVCRGIGVSVYVFCLGEGGVEVWVWMGQLPCLGWSCSYWRYGVNVCVCVRACVICLGVGGG